MINSIFNTNNIMRSDSYKTTHWLQYPPGTTHIYSYLESRGGLFNELVMAGTTYYLKEFLSRQITMADIDYAEKRITAHMGPGIFNRKGWERIVNIHNGYFPVRIKALPEGTVVGPHNILMSIENTDPELPWVTNYVETLMLKIWYPIAVATQSREMKKLILQYLVETGDPAGVDFKLHDFGYRGVSSEESAAIGGFAHLINFKGTDTMIALELAYLYYGEETAGFSIPAAEHSTVTAWGREFEYEAYENMIKCFGKGSLYAVVSDSYNIYNACEEIWGEQLRQKVFDANAILVVRPDSGTPHEVVLRIAEILGEKFGYVENDKGYKILNHVRIIQGDGINLEEIGRILEVLKSHGWSADNVAFGCGGVLLQQLNRDTLKFAFKCSSMERNGRVYDVYKNPVGDSGKQSKRGRLKLIWTGSEGYKTVRANEVPGHDVLQTVWENGKLLVEPTLAEIRERAKVEIPQFEMV